MPKAENDRLSSRHGPDRIELRIQDSGFGVPVEERRRIFLPLVSGWGGSGLGLPVARQILHQHGGTLDLEPSPGSGATFLVRLPRADRIPQEERAS